MKTKVKRIIAVTLLIIGMAVTSFDLAHLFGVGQYLWNGVFILVGIPALLGLYCLDNPYKEDGV